MKTLGEIRARVEERHAENVRRFDNIDSNIEALTKDVHSLMSSRAFTRGVWKTVSIVAAVISAAVSVAMTWLNK